MKKKLSMFIHLLFFSLALYNSISCGLRKKSPVSAGEQTAISVAPSKQNTSKVIHVFVALCDNINQGIVKVPAAIGNGQDPGRNLYWGAAYGVKSYLKKQADWKLIKSEQRSGVVLERCLFKHKTENLYMIADAYDGAKKSNRLLLIF